MNIYLILLFTFIANARLTSLFVSEIGPFYLFVNFRYALGYVYTNPYEDQREMTLEEVQQAFLNGTISLYNPKKSSLLSELISCVYCMSLWISIFTTLCYSLFVFNLTAYEFFAIFLSSSAFSIYLIEKRL